MTMFFLFIRQHSKLHWVQIQWHWICKAWEKVKLGSMARVSADIGQATWPKKMAVAPSLVITAVNTAVANAFRTVGNLHKDGERKIPFYIIVFMVNNCS